MSVAVDDDWRSEFGILADESNQFFADAADLDAPGTAPPQSYAVRRAFELLALDGVLCSETAPLVYFKQVERIVPAEVSRLHGAFWNHGGAAVLALIAPDQVHIYSSLSQPDKGTSSPSSPMPTLVESLQRASSALREFLPAVESGEYFRHHRELFNPEFRVDRVLLDNLHETRRTLLAASGSDAAAMDALLCRLVFVCYLFYRQVIGQPYLEEIGVPNASHLRDVLATLPRAEAKRHLYALFQKLGEDFNGDLFSDDLAAEARQVSLDAIDVLDRFFHATNVTTGQTQFWPYDFAAMPVELISAIYERFLKNDQKSQGAFYTPRFLAELVIDLALAKTSTLLGRRYFDPACGSGIFLVCLFNRISEEWKRENPAAPYDQRARALRAILCGELAGVDVNPTACRITAFSLYVAYLTQLRPPDIQALQRSGRKLPRLIHYTGSPAPGPVEGNIWCGDFFEERAPYPADADFVIGNPPWGRIAGRDSLAAKWCAEPSRQYPFPYKQIAAAFVWKAADHAKSEGAVCLVLPHGTLFHHGGTALAFQGAFFRRYSVDHVLNLADYRHLLFEEARHPAIVIAYRPVATEDRGRAIEYWSPKADWLALRANVVTIQPEDRSTLRVRDVLDGLSSSDAPHIWKQHFWATSRDRRIFDRLSFYARLSDRVRRIHETADTKPWLIAEGFQPIGKGDDAAKAVTIRLPTRAFVQARSAALQGFLTEESCSHASDAEIKVRGKSNKDTRVFHAPHVLVAKGFSRIAYADFDVTFRHALRGISGPPEDRPLLMFLAAYLRSPLARYIAFHTSSSWGIGRPEVHVEEILRLPFPLIGRLPCVDKR